MIPYQLQNPIQISTSMVRFIRAHRKRIPWDGISQAITLLHHHVLTTLQHNHVMFIRKKRWKNPFMLQKIIKSIVANNLMNIQGKMLVIYRIYIKKKTLIRVRACILIITAHTLRFLGLRVVSTTITQQVVVIIIDISIQQQIWTLVWILYR